MRVIMKFGGTSVGSPEMIGRVSKLVQERSKLDSPVVVVSAMGGLTDQLIHIARLFERREQTLGHQALDAVLTRHHQVIERLLPHGELRDSCVQTIATLYEELVELSHGVSLLRELTPRTLDLYMSFGERLSAVLVAAVLCATGTPAEAIDAREMVLTDSRFGNARVQDEETRQRVRQRLLPLLDKQVVPVVTGFIASNEEGVTTTLGRGGSDFSASLVGACLEVDEIEIWTDVDGVMTADPRLVKEARVLPEISYREAAEMAYFGAKVLHPLTVLPAVQRNIPLRIRNTFNPEATGTRISAETGSTSSGIKTVTSIRDKALVTIEGNGMIGVPGIARRVFTATSEGDVNVIMISQSSSEHGISFVVSREDALRTVELLSTEFGPEMSHGLIDQIDVRQQVGILAIIGEGMQGTPGISGRLFGALGKSQINVLAIAQGSSELNISVVVEESAIRQAVRAVHTAFGLTRVVNVFLYGIGNVGRTLLRQIQQGRAALLRAKGIELRVLGVSNSRSCLFDDQGLGEEMLARLTEGRRPETIPGSQPYDSHEALLDLLSAGHDTDIAIVDVTASESIPLHLGALSRGFSVVTANKKPLAAPFEQYRDIWRLAREHGVSYHYETTFGAGLPFLFTLQDLLATGDEVHHIVGCFSGTLGFLCTELEKGRSLSAVVKEAHSLGYTEPDPRDDLSGMDVARKALIIARELGLEVNLANFALEGFLSDPRIVEAADLDEFWRQLPLADGPLAERVEGAMAANRRLRYVAEISSERLTVGLREVEVDHPVGQLFGPDNILIYTTRRYHQNPLIIRGPGAGAEVTAAGVLGDLIKVATRG